MSKCEHSMQSWYVDHGRIGCRDCDEESARECGGGACTHCTEADIRPLPTRKAWERYSSDPAIRQRLDYQKLRADGLEVRLEEMRKSNVELRSEVIALREKIMRVRVALMVCDDPMENDITDHDKVTLAIEALGGQQA